MPQLKLYDNAFDEEPSQVLDFDDVDDIQDYIDANASDGKSLILKIAS